MKRKQTKPRNPRHVWVTADKRAITLAEMGDSHLVNVLKMIENELNLFRNSGGSHPPHANHLRLYPVFVAEAIKRGLFDWTPERKYVSQTIRTALKKAALLQVKKGRA